MTSITENRAFCLFIRSWDGWR